jgi:hypothetical protein
VYRRVGKIEIQLFRLGLSQLVSVVNIVVYRSVGRIEIQLFRLGLSQLVSVVNRQVNCGSEGNSGGSGCGGVASDLFEIDPCCSRSEEIVISVKYCSLFKT